MQNHPQASYQLLRLLQCSDFWGMVCHVSYLEAQFAQGDWPQGHVHAIPPTIVVLLDNNLIMLVIYI